MTRRCAAKCASSRADGCRIRRSSVPRSACSGCRTSRKSSSRTSRWRAARTWWMSTSTSRKGCRASSAAASATRRRQKFSLNGNFVHSNFMGTGDRIALEINAGKYSKSYTFAHTDPYTTIDGVARTTSLTLRDVTQFVAASSAFSTKQITGAMQWAYPISEYQFLSVGASANKNSLVVSQGYSAQQSVDWVKQNGNTFQRELTDTNGDGVINSLDSPVHRVRHGFLHLRADRRLVLRGPQPRVVPRPRHEGGAVGALRAALERCSLLPDELRLHHVHPVMAQVLDLGARRRWTTPRRSAKRRPCRPTSTTSPAARTASEASARAAWGPGTTSASATPTAAISASSIATS